MSNGCKFTCLYVVNASEIFCTIITKIKWDTEAALVLTILNRSYSFLQIRRTTIKARMSLNFVKIPSPIKELSVLKNLKN